MELDGKKPLLTYPYTFHCYSSCFLSLLLLQLRFFNKSPDKSPPLRLEPSHRFSCNETDSYSSSPLAWFPWSTPFSSSTCFITVPLSHLISDSNTPSNRGHHSQCVCVRERVSAWPHTLEGTVSGKGRWVSLSDPICPSGPCSPSRWEKIRWKCNHNQLGSRRGRKHAHTHANTFHSTSAREPCRKLFWTWWWGEGGLGCGEGVFLIYIFNVKYHSKRES